MSLHIINLTPRHTGIGIRRTQHRHLRRRIRRHQPIRPTIRIHRRPTHHRQHPITISNRISQPLEHHHPSTLTTHKTIRRSIKRMTRPRPRQRLSHVKTPRHRRRQHHIHTTGQRHIRIPTTQTLTRQMHRNQRRRTRRIHRQRRPPPIKKIRHPISDNAQRTTGTRIRIHTPQIRRRQIPILTQTRTRKNTSQTAPQRLHRKTGILQRLIHNLQQQPLLRIHLRRLPRRHLKKLRIKTTHIIQKRPPPRRPRQRSSRLRRPHPKRIPPPSRNLTNRRQTLTHKTPQRLRTTHPTRKTTPHTHHSNQPLIRARASHRTPHNTLINNRGLNPTQKTHQRIHRRMSPQLHRRHRPPHQLRQLTRQHHRILRPHTEITQRRITINLTNTTPQNSNQIINQPPPQGLLPRGRGHTVRPAVSVASRR